MAQCWDMSLFESLAVSRHRLSYVFCLMACPSSLNTEIFVSASFPGCNLAKVFARRIDNFDFWKNEVKY